MCNKIDMLDNILEARSDEDEVIAPLSALAKSARHEFESSKGHTLPIGTDTHCPYCALQCCMTLVLKGAELRVTARNFPTNKGGLCRKG